MKTILHENEKSNLEVRIGDLIRSKDDRFIAIVTNRLMEESGWDNGEYDYECIILHNHYELNTKFYVGEELTLHHSDVETLPKGTKLELIV